MRLPVLLAIAGILQAQPPLPLGITRGKLVSVTPTQLTIRNNAGLAACNYDSRTWFERNFEMTRASKLLPGDPVEILADRKLGACYARTVQVTTNNPHLYTPGVRPPLRAFQSPTESFAPRGDFAFGGWVIHRDPSRVTVRTHAGEIQVVLRPDTRFSGDGLSLDASSLDINTHVFIRAGRNVDGDLEAYQIMWGELLGPQ